QQCAVDDDRNNIYGVSAAVSPLLDNGGPTQTFVPLDGSPLIDAGNCTDSAGKAVTTDQRGTARPIGATCDIGAVESPGVPGGNQFACWDTNQNGACNLPAEDTNKDGDCAPNDCQGQNG